MQEPLGSVRLVVVTGPIASGKTTLARDLASSARLLGYQAAAIDMDDLVEITAGDDWTKVTADHWATARKLCGRASELLFDSGYRFVFVSGPFFNAPERQDLLQHFSHAPETNFVMLSVSLAESQRRCEADSDENRFLTKNPDFVANLYATIPWANLPPGDLTIETDHRTAAQVLVVASKAILGRVTPILDSPNS